eukprot:5863221-Heterocapsa_arctica.AAC.1
MLSRRERISDFLLEQGSFAPESLVILRALSDDLSSRFDPCQDFGAGAAVGGAGGETLALALALAGTLGGGALPGAFLS